jgi:hypothetical protein
MRFFDFNIKTLWALFLAGRDNKILHVCRKDQAPVYAKKYYLPHNASSA